MDRRHDREPGMSERQTGFLGLAQLMLAALPPAFVGLVLVNVIFVGLILWFLNDIQRERMKFAAHVLDTCTRGEMHR